MEKPAVKAKFKFLSLLPKAAAAIRFQNPDPFSPRRDKKAGVNANKLKAHQNRGFSGPITSMLLEEGRSKSKNSRFDEAKEPTSPKISCMGQIKHKKKICKKKRVSKTNEVKPFSSHPDSENKPPSAAEVKKKKKNKKSNSVDMFLRSEKLAGRKSDAAPDKAPSLSQMKRFASGRNAITNFDWTTAEVSPDDYGRDCRRYYSDEERGDSEAEEEEVIIPFSAPILIDGAGSGFVLEPRKEINLWKRRTMSQPKPLQLHI